ncbi:MAG: hypothetical protein ACOCUT_00250 [bacterium]
MGVERWQEFDKNNNCIHFKDSYGYEEWYEYSNGYEYWQKFDENNNLIYSKNSDGG